MGIIQRQTFWTTIISLLGIVVGTLSQVIMPFVFEDEAQIGALALLNSVSRIFAVFACFGFTQITLQVFKNFRDEDKGHSGYLVFALLFSLAGGVLGVVSFGFLQDFAVGVGEGYKLIRSISYLIFPIIFFRIFFTNLDIYLRMLYSSVLGAFLETVLLKFIILVGILLFWLSWIDYKQMAYVYALALSIPGFLLVVLALMKTKSITWPKKIIFEGDNKRKMVNYGFFGIMATASGVVIVSIDQIMLNKMLGTDSVGVYSVLFFAGAIVSVPSRGLKRIAVPILSESWKEKDFNNISVIYEKSANTLTAMGVYLFVVGWLCVEPALNFLPKFQEGLYVFFFIGLTQIIDMMTGVNMEIIATSDKYKMNTYFNVVLAILVIGLNYVFILLWGIVGAGVATALAAFLVNFGRWYYLKRNFNLQPLNSNTLIIVAIGAFLIIIFKLIPLDISPLWRMGFYTTTITLIYWLVILKFELSPEINDWLIKLKARFIK